MPSAKELRAMDQPDSHRQLSCMRKLSMEVTVEACPWRLA